MSLAFAVDVVSVSFSRPSPSAPPLDHSSATTQLLTYHASPAGLWVITRLSLLARQQSGGLFRKDCVFRLFAAAATVLDSCDLRPYLLPMLHALYRFADSPPLNSSQAAADLKRLAQQTIDALRKNSTSEDFIMAYSHVRKVVTEIRAARKKWVDILFARFCIVLGWAGSVGGRHLSECCRPRR